MALDEGARGDGGEIDIPPRGQPDVCRYRHASARGEALYDVTFENVQAGCAPTICSAWRTTTRLVVGTGDLSELALGWCTYGVGDHMSHYNPTPRSPRR